MQCAAPGRRPHPRRRIEAASTCSTAMEGSPPTASPGSSTGTAEQAARPTPRSPARRSRPIKPEIIPISQLPRTGRSSRGHCGPCGCARGPRSRGRPEDSGVRVGVTQGTQIDDDLRRHHTNSLLFASCSLAFEPPEGDGETGPPMVQRAPCRSVATAPPYRARRLRPQATRFRPVPTTGLCRQAQLLEPRDGARLAGRSRDGRANRGERRPARAGDASPLLRRWRMAAARAAQRVRWRQAGGHPSRSQTPSTPGVLDGPTIEGLVPSPGCSTLEVAAGAVGSRCPSGLPSLKDPDLVAVTNRQSGIDSGGSVDRVDSARTVANGRFEGLHRVWYPRTVGQSQTRL